MVDNVTALPPRLMRGKEVLEKDSSIIRSSRLCKHPEGCRKHPIFGFPGSRATHCNAHKLEGMENVRAKRCKEPGCKILCPGFDVIGGKGSYCSSHQKTGMENVKNKRCEEAGCKILPSYGDPEKKVRRFCATHKLQDMILLAKRRKKIEISKSTTSSKIST